MSAGYVITTYKMQLNYKHLDWLQCTEKLFNDVLAFYYNVLDQDKALLDYSNQNLLRQLELKTIKQRDGTLPETPLPFIKVPLYFRRAATNTAISMMRGYIGRIKTYEKQKMQAGKEGKPYKYSHPNPPVNFNVSMVYYKGMYKAFDEKSVMLKLYNGKSWVWVKHRYTGRPFPKEAEPMSPTIVVRKKKVMLHIPIKEIVEDIRTAKARVEEHEKFCAVTLTGSDALAVCTIIEADGSATHPYFIKGGKEMAHRRKLLQGYAERAKHQVGKNTLDRRSDVLDTYDAVGNVALDVPPIGTTSKKEVILSSTTPGKKYYKKITKTTDHYAHRVSRQIVNHAKEHGAKLIVLPDLEESLRNHQKYYLGNTTFTFIGRRIIEYTRYKAWQSGIVVMTSRPYHASSRCYYCNEAINKYNKEWQVPSKNFYGGKNFICETGHQGSTHLNTARNLGKAFHKTFYKAA